MWLVSCHMIALRIVCYVPGRYLIHSWGCPGWEKCQWELGIPVPHFQVLEYGSCRRKKKMPSLEKAMWEAEFMEISQIFIRIQIWGKSSEENISIFEIVLIISCKNLRKDLKEWESDGMDRRVRDMAVDQWAWAFLCWLIARGIKV